MGGACAAHWIRYSDTSARERTCQAEVALAQGELASAARRPLVDRVDRASGTSKFDRCRRPTLAPEAGHAVWPVLNGATPVLHRTQFLPHAGLELEMNVGPRAVKKSQPAGRTDVID